ncbi:FtsK/SpoIIIE family DNA translocase [Pajaroellobacter abortibovis]|uniref:FtsK domain-containing protein n=1 Tax=Pajaroellobacter abortibovis TaxID=1882918 RepID=A0A1L6MYB7_9BACT|nr:DNA translocase FtsK [Pajaroellobacter abortibovis]APS00561.1 hypothetical protein BCY86_07660 [Pajaroellobacter abortibovis]
MSGSSSPPPNAHSPSIVGKGARAYGLSREITALFLWTSSLFLLLALASYEEGVEKNWVGPVGRECADALVLLLGVVAWAAPVELAIFAFPLFRGQNTRPITPRLAGDLVIALILGALLQVSDTGLTFFGAQNISGALGELLGEWIRSLFSTAGSFLIGFSIIGFILVGRASFSFIAFVRLIWICIAKGGRVLWMAVKCFIRLGKDAIGSHGSNAKPLSASPPSSLLNVDKYQQDGEKEHRGEKEEMLLLGELDQEQELDLGLACGVSEALAEAAIQGVSYPSPVVYSDEAGPLITFHQEEGGLEHQLEEVDLKPIEEKEEMETPCHQSQGGEEINTQEEPFDNRKMTCGLEERLAHSLTANAFKQTSKRKREVQAPVYTFPPLSLLTPSRADSALNLDKEAFLKNASLLVKTLGDYGVQGKVEDILPGPTVTTYEVSPAAGTKVSKVASLADDLALALARKVRIVAPIPGKNRIGFELPNDRRIPVHLRDLIEDNRFYMLEAALPIVLGRDILGTPVYADLATMPHVIVAGATGAGKSVGLNVMLTSLLYRKKPDELKLLLIDPKVVELAPFDRVPHMLLPVVTDMKQAATALKWAVDEMERRYQLFADAGTRNLGTYNESVDRVRQKGDQFSSDVKGSVDNPSQLRSSPLQKLPLIVVVVDEFADLIMQQGKEVEAAIARLAQKARAAGMHVILATQRPSVDVITGMIKANFPTRIAYRVAQKVDSRTILDEQGAEHLLGRGDMLIKLNGTNDMKRVQCPWVSEEEVRQVTDFLRSHGEPVYDESILQAHGEEEEIEDSEFSQEDLVLYEDALRVVKETKRCSASWLQRKLGLGYNRAAKIVDRMERQGLVGPPNGSKDREIFIVA